MAKSTQLKWVGWFYILFSWSTVVYAAQNDKFLTGMQSIPLESFKYVIIIVGLSGAAATLTKLTKENAPRIRSLPLEIAKDVVTSFAAGVLAFLVAGWVDSSIYAFPFWLHAIFIFLAGWGGGNFLETAFNEGMTQGVVPMFRNFINRVLGRQQEAPAPPPPVTPPVQEETPQ